MHLLPVSDPVASQSNSCSCSVSARTEPSIYPSIQIHPSIHPTSVDILRKGKNRDMNKTQGNVKTYCGFDFGVSILVDSLCHTNQSHEIMLKAVTALLFFLRDHLENVLTDTLASGYTTDTDTARPRMRSLTC